jgi:putative heme-binding domain-containing protein
MRTRVLVGIALSVTLIAWSATPPAWGQEPSHGVTPAELERGGQVYLASCASCHGANGDTLPNVDLASGTFRRATTDQQLISLVRTGIPGTAMQPSSISEADATLVVAYLRAWPARRLASGASAPTPVGNAERGLAVFNGRGGCRECHVAGGSGGFLGPDLSSVGLTRRPAELDAAMVDPDAEIRNGNRSAIVTYRDGKTVTGRLLNHDTYSLQLIDTGGRLLSVMKDEVRRWEIPSKSVMPSYRETLTAAERADVLSYLLTQRTPVANAPGGRGAGGAPGAAAPGAGPRGGGPAPTPPPVSPTAPTPTTGGPR